MSGKNTAEDTAKKFFELSNNQMYSRIEEYVTHNYMNSLAHVLIYLPQDRRNGVIAKLPDGVRDEVKSIVSGIADKTRIDSDVIDAVLRAMDLHKTDNDVFKSIPVLSKFVILFSNTFYSKDPVLVELISGSVSDVFENMIQNVLDDVAVKKMNEEDSSQKLSCALKFAEAETQERIFSFMTNHAARMLKEDMEFIGPVRLADVKKAQADILHLIWQLMVCGKIKIPLEKVKQNAQTDFEKAQESVFALVEEYMNGGYLEWLAGYFVYLPEVSRKNTLSKMPYSIKPELENILAKMKDKRRTDRDVMKSVKAICPKNESENLSEETYFYLDLHSDEYCDENPILMDNLGYFNFDKILPKLGDRAVQKVFREVAPDVLATALKKASPETQEKFFINMSTRMAEMVEDDMKQLGEVSLEAAKKAQLMIKRVIRRLERDGEIVIPGDSDDEQFVG